MELPPITENYMVEAKIGLQNQGQVGVVIVTHNAKHHLPRCLPPYLESSLKPKVMVVNSSSKDGTVELAKEMGAEVLIIPRNEFNHGITRERARKHLNTQIVVMATPDAYPKDNFVLEKLLEPLFQNFASVSYARQIPHQGADFFESFPRKFNYNDKSHLRSIEDLSKYGVLTFFCSNSCAAYQNSALDEIGGFRETLTAEDFFAVARLLSRGHKVAYSADAVVFHSHRYNLIQEFKRYFDTGLVHAWNKEFLSFNEVVKKRGQDFFKNLIGELWREDRLLIPYGILNTGVKWFGYKLGLQLAPAPDWIKRKFSSQEYYWDSSIKKELA
jgi:rhamnosyltransferase